MISPTSLNPYAIYIKIALAAALVAFLFWLGWHEMGIRADLKAKIAEAALNKAAAEQNHQRFQEYVRLNKEVADAIQQIKIRSNNYIQAIEASPSPAAADGDSVVLVPSGVPVGAAPAGLSGFKNHTSGRAAAAPAGDPGG